MLHCRSQPVDHAVIWGVHWRAKRAGLGYFWAFWRFRRVDYWIEGRLPGVDLAIGGGSAIRLAETWRRAPGLS